MNQRKNDDVSNGINVCEPILLRQFELRYDELVDQGAETLNSMEPKSFGYAELQRRLKQKISGCFRSWQSIADGQASPLPGSGGARGLYP
jgi:hypothetical protein